MYFKSITFSILFPVLGLAQSIDINPYVEGYVFDAEKREPIPFATIKVKGWAKGVVTNRNGSFKVPKKFAELNDTLVISSMGYDNKVISLHEIMTEELNIVFLEPHVYGLDETVVYAEKKKKKRLSAKGIVRKAIRNIPENYPHQAFGLSGYYRDYQWHENDYLNLNEAIISIYDQGFGSKDLQSTAFSLHHIVMNENFARDSISEKPYNYKNKSKIIDMAQLDAYGGNELQILRVHDAIRNYDISSYAFVYKLKNQFLSNHRFKRGDDVFLDNKPFYNITFTNSQNGYSALGNILVDKQNYSIYNMNYTLFHNDIDVKVNSGASEIKKQLIFEVLSEYRPFNEQMFLNYITFNNRFLLPESPRFYMEQYYVNIRTQRLAITLNNPAERKNAIIPSNYELTFRGESLPVEEVVLDILNPKILYIFPSFESREEERGFYRYFKNFKGNASEKLQLSLTNITDTQGNLINKVYDYREYQQFREFFTQQVHRDFEAPAPAFLMNMKSPVFEGQPLHEKEDLQEYWMNTPLKIIDD